MVINNGHQQWSWTMVINNGHQQWSISVQEITHQISRHPPRNWCSDWRVGSYDFRDVPGQQINFSVMGLDQLVMGIPNSWMVCFMENPIVRNGGWLGVPQWLRKPPYLFIRNLLQQAKHLSLKVWFCSGSSSSNMAPEGLNMALRVSLSISSSRITGLFTWQLTRPDGYGGFLKWRYPKMDGLWWKIPLKWMMTGGTPTLGNLHMFFLKIGYPMLFFRVYHGK